MLEVIAPDGLSLDKYLEIEQQLVGKATDDLLMTWVVAPTVIIGRHQVLENEVNVPYCRQENIPIIRRQSGGGCVYADEGNMMISWVSSSPHPEDVFHHYLTSICQALTSIGIPAVRSQHNDIMVGDRKISGNACYALSSGTIVHGTMLYDVDFNRLQQAITPSAEKLQKHGVDSVRQRVANLCELIDVRTCPPLHSMDSLRRWIGGYFCERQVELAQLI